MTKKSVVRTMAFVVAVLLAAVVYAQPVVRVITFQFEKPVVEADLNHFELGWSLNAVFSEPFDSLAEPTSGTWEQFPDIPFTGAMSVYTHPEPLSTPADVETRYWFRIRAVDDAGNQSGWCYGHDVDGPCTFLADNLAPGVLIQFQILTVEKKAEVE